MEPTIQLFVYGSLLRGEFNHSQLAGSPCLGEAATDLGFSLVDLGAYPGMVKAGRGCVAGEVFAVTRAKLAELDRFEQHPDVYWRTTVRLADRRLVQAYLLRPELARGRRRIRSGDWRRRAATIPAPSAPDR